MTGANGIGTLFDVAYGAALYGGIDETWALAALALVTFLAPNTQELMARFHPGLASFPPRTRPHLAWQPRPVWSLVMVAALLLALSRMSGVSPFLYYQF